MISEKPSIDTYFKTAMRYPLDRLVAVMQGRDKSIPQTVAMMALQIKEPRVDAARAQQAMQEEEEPSVKERMEQQVAMLPENVGIMNLPVEQEYADGGIVAFGPGGSTTLASKPELNAQTIRQLYRTDPRLAREAIERVTDVAERRRLLGAVGVPGFVADTGFGLSTAAADAMANMTPEQRKGFYDNNVFGGAMSGDAGFAGAILNAPQMAAPKGDYFGGLGKAITTPFRMLVGDPSLDAERRERERKTPPADVTSPDYAARARNIYQQSPTAEAPAAPPTQFIDARTAPPAAPSAGKGKGKGKGAGAGTGPAGPKKEEAAPPSPFVPGEKGDLAAELTKYKGLFPDVTKEYDTLKTETEAGYKKLAEERERTKPKEKAYEGLEKLLAKEEGEAKGKEARNLNMALVNAGLAIAGGKSQYALQNIAEGAQVGTKQYMAGLEKLEEAAKERRRQAATIEEARRAEARGDWKEAQQLNKEAFDAKLGIQRLKIEGVAKITGDTIKTATERVNTLDQIAARDRQVQEQVRAEREKAILQYKADMARTGALGESNTIQKQLMAQQRGEEGMKNWLANNKISALDMQTKNPQLYFQYRDYFMRKAHQDAGLPYTGGVAQAGPKLSAEETDALKLYTGK